MQSPMNNASDREVAVFNAVLQLPAGQRAACLDRECAGDAALRQKIEALLRVHDEVGTFLESPTQGAGTSAAAPHGQNATMRINPPPAEKVGDRIGRYKLREQIGEGGCGVVYAAEQLEPVRRKVAIKVIKLGMDTKHVIARFEAERQALGLMDHPNIAKVLDAGATETGRPYFVMELVRGIKITDYCDQNKLSTDERLKLFTQVCQAIQHAHQKGIIHRDIKPSNILVTMHDGEPVPKVIDFGIAKATEGRLTDLTIYTELQQFIGTPAYMSPEQAEMSGLDNDTRSDIYALGVLLYELLTGKTPFDARDLIASGIDAMRRTIREREPERPSTALSTMLAADLTNVARQRQSEAPKLVHLVRGDLDWIVMKALGKDRTRRYETANGLAMDVQRHLDDEPVVARPPTNTYRFQKLLRRNKLAVSAVGGVLAALIIGLGVSSWLFLKERQARERAVAAEREAQAARQNEATLRQQAQADEKKATTEADKSQQVAQFLQQMLKSVGPSVALGRDTTMLREILAKTAESVAKELPAQPEVEAELQNTIGEVYNELGEYQQAEAMHRAALALRRQALGQENLPVAQSLHNLALALKSQDKDADPSVRAALALRRKLLGEEHRDVASSLNLLANVLMNQGSVAEVEALRRQVLAIQRKLRNDEGAATALNNLALNLLDQGKLAEAESLLRDAVATYRKAFTGNDHPDTSRSLGNLAFVLQKEGDLAKAEATQREALAMQTRLFGVRHSFVAESTLDLALLLQKEGRLAEAEKLFNDVLTPEVEGQPWTSHLLYSRGILHARLGRWEEASTALAPADV